MDALSFPIPRPGLSPPWPDRKSSLNFLSMMPNSPSCQPHKITPPPKPPPHDIRPTPTLTNLPVEITLHILSYLNPGHSACLGLTCKRLYKLHREIHGNVSLHTRCPVGEGPGLQLLEFLGEWYPPGFRHCLCGFVKIKAVEVGLFLIRYHVTPLFQLLEVAGQS
jgi:F-box-like